MSKEYSSRVAPFEGFLDDASRDIHALRDSWPALESGDAAAWGRARTVAHNLAARSVAAELGVLRACARELEQLALERDKGAPLDAFFLQCAGSAIEALSLEVDALRRA